MKSTKPELFKKVVITQFDKGAELNEIKNWIMMMFLVGTLIIGYLSFIALIIYLIVGIIILIIHIIIAHFQSREVFYERIESED